MCCRNSYAMSLVLCLTYFVFSSCSPFPYQEREAVHSVVVWVTGSQIVPSWRPCRRNRLPTLDAKTTWPTARWISNACFYPLSSLYFVQSVLFLKLCTYILHWFQWNCFLVDVLLYKSETFTCRIFKVKNVEISWWEMCLYPAHACLNNIIACVNKCDGEHHLCFVFYLNHTKNLILYPHVHIDEQAEWYRTIIQCWKYSGLVKNKDHF